MIEFYRRRGGYKKGQNLIVLAYNQKEHPTQYNRKKLGWSVRNVNDQ